VSANSMPWRRGEIYTTISEWGRKGRSLRVNSNRRRESLQVPFYLRKDLYYFQGQGERVASAYVLRGKKGRGPVKENKSLIKKKRSKSIFRKKKFIYLEEGEN